MRTSIALAGLLPSVLLVGCVDMLPLSMQPGGMPAPVVENVILPQPQAGSLYADGASMALFEDNKAHNVGDLLTVLLVESTQAKKSATTTTSKSADVGLGKVSAFGKTFNTAAGLSGDRSFDGKGDSAQSNSLSGSVTVTVVQRMANGNLRVAGEKLLQLNQGSEVVKLEGIVRPSDISTGNSISSDRVASAKVTYAGRGALADSNAQGWVSRFFNSPWMPF